MAVRWGSAFDRTGRVATTGMFSMSLPEECSSSLRIELFDEHIGLAAEANPKTSDGVDGERTLVITAMDGAIGPDPFAMHLGIMKILLREQGHTLSFAGDDLCGKGGWTGLKQMESHRAFISFRTNKNPLDCLSYSGWREY